MSNSKRKSLMDRTQILYSRWSRTKSDLHLTRAEQCGAVAKR